MERGFIKIFRKIIDSEIWNEKPFSRGQAWIDLILLANHKEGYYRVRGVRVDVKRGQVGTSSKSLAIRWGWSRGKVLRFLGELETVQQIVQQKNNVTTLIDIINYDIYQQTVQQTVQQTGRKRDANGTQTDTNKKDKKDKKEKKEKIEKEKQPVPSKKIQKNKFGTFKNVLLSEEEFQTLEIALNENLQKRIDSLSEYIESHGRRYKSHYATILSWARKDGEINQSIAEIKKQWKDDQEWKKRRDMRLRAVKQCN